MGQAEVKPTRRERYRFYACLDNMLWERLEERTGQPQPARGTKSSHLFIAYEYDESSGLYQPREKGVRTTGPGGKGQAARSYVASWLDVKRTHSTDGGIGGLATAILEALDLKRSFKAKHTGREIRRIATEKGVPILVHYAESHKYAKLINITPDLDQAFDHIGTKDPYTDTQTPPQR